VILLDTNYLIRFLVPGTAEAERVTGWVGEQTELCTSAICWYEFLCGPVDEEGMLLVSSVLNERILPFTSAHALEASRLYNGCGRKRTLRADAMIAAAAIVSQTALATGNREDFAPFETFGLELV
jgi:predicted nucleic acid-binding protein